MDNKQKLVNLLQLHLELQRKEMLGHEVMSRKQEELKSLICATETLKSELLLHQKKTGEIQDSVTQLLIEVDSLELTSPTEKQLRKQICHIQK